MGSADDDEKPAPEVPTEAPAPPEDGGDGEAPAGEGENAGEAPPPEPKKNKKKGKKIDIMSDEPLKFKAVSFDHAITAEEKAAKKAAKLAAKKGGKKAKKPKEEEPPPPPEEPKQEDVLEDTPKERMIIAEMVTKEAEPKKKEKKKKKEKSEEGLEKKKDKKKGKKGAVESLPDVPKFDEEEKKDAEKIVEGEEAVGGGEETQPEEFVEPAEAAKSKSGVKKGKGKKGKKEKKIAVDASQVSTTEGATTEGEGEPEGGDQEAPQKGKKGKKAGKKEKGGKKKKGAEEGAASETTEATTTAESEAELLPEDDEDMLRETPSRLKKGKAGKGKKGAEATESEIEMKQRKAVSMKSLASSRASSLTTRSKSKMKSSLSYGLFDEGSEGSSSDSESKMKLKDGETESGDELAKRTKKGKGKGKKGKGKKAKEVTIEEVDETEAPVVPPPAPEAPKAPEPKKEEKEQKEKKGKKKKGKKEEAPAEDEDDVMAQIMKMKLAAAAPSTEATTEPSMVSKKKGKKEKGGKKLSKKDKAKLEAQRVEEARIQAELDAQMALEEEQRRLANLRKNAKEKDKRDTAEQALRNDQLGVSTALIKGMMDANWAISMQEKADAEWAQYLKCDGLPDPSNPADMNTYLHLWEQVVESTTPDECSRRTDEVILLLNALNDFIDDPFDETLSIIEDWYWVRLLCREAQQENLDMTTYLLVRDIDSRLNRLNIPTADYRIVDDNFVLCLWLLVQLATPMYNPRSAQRPRLDIKFPELKMSVLFPGEVDGKCMVIRGIYVKYDHLSDTCHTFDPPPVPSDHDMDLLTAIGNEWYVKMMYKWTHRKRKKIMVEDENGTMVDTGEYEPEPELVEGELPPPIPFQLLEPTASEHAISIEDETYERIRQALIPPPPDSDKSINLRKFLIIGGVYYLNLFYQPPQPHDKVAFDIRLTALLIPKRLSEVPFIAKFSPPIPEDPENKKTPEELEEDMKLQEQELDRLILFSITLPEHVIFLDLPTICAWDDDAKVWTTEDIQDVRHIEEKNMVMFRTVHFGAFSFAVNRYINLPFQTWELKPEPDGTVTFQLTCAILMVEFNVKGNKLCLTQLQNSPNNALQDMIGQYFKLPKLIRILREGGVDLFPAFDAFNYVENGVCEKHWPLEKHLYYLMGLLSACFNFTWSRWNVQAGRRNIVIQMREFKHDRPKQQNHHMLLVTPQKALYIDCTEVSPTFTEEPTEGMKFYADVYQLMKGTTTMSTKSKVASSPLDVSKAVADLLMATRIHSFS